MCCQEQKADQTEYKSSTCHYQRISAITSGPVTEEPQLLPETAVICTAFTLVLSFKVQSILEKFPYVEKNVYSAVAGVNVL